MTKKQIKEKIITWCDKNGHPKKDIKQILHIHIYCYVLGYAAPNCIIVATPWSESQENLKKLDKENPINIINEFDKNLKPGDWCVTACVAGEDFGTNIAINHTTFFNEMSDEKINKIVKGLKKISNQKAKKLNKFIEETR